MFLIGRAQKIATATYLVSGLFPEREPLREALRKDALELLSDIRNLSDSELEAERVTASVRAVLERILSLSTLALRSGMVSPMNHDFLKAELESFANDINALSQAKKDSIPIERSLKGTEAMSAGSLMLLKDLAHKGHSKGHGKGHGRIVIKRDSRSIFGEFKEMNGSIKDIAVSVQSGNDRKEKIRRIIEEKGSLTIKDIAGVAPEYSEKTIQRDLVDMVESGRLKKKGERRWTVYFV
ncbi:MAG TPA: hypothetical protein VJ837_04050 [Candidatus Paceibacterota bacterium]|nr:hypothetical protein [Candidatus Paceibacterota bacterium]